MPGSTFAFEAGRRRARAKFAAPRLDLDAAAATARTIAQGVAQRVKGLDRTIASGARSWLGGSNVKRNLNLAGLGLLTVPSLASLLGTPSEDREERHRAERAHHLADLAGLGILAGTEFLH